MISWGARRCPRRIGALHWRRAPGDVESPIIVARTSQAHDDLRAAVTAALEVGGTEAPWQPPDRDRERIRVLLDPAGHPLCLFLCGE